MSNQITVNNIKGNIVRLGCLSAGIAMLTISVIVYKAPIQQFVIMGGFFLFYIQLPGMYIARWANLNKEHMSTFLIISTFCGWALIVFLYFISDWLNNNIALLIMGPLMSLHAIWMIVRGKRDFVKQRRIIFRNIPISFCLFLLVLLLYCLLKTQYLYLFPAASDFSSMNADKAYHMGLINSLSHDYPLQSPWIAGVFINYHILSEMMFSVPVRLFGVEADFATQSFGPILTSYTFGFALYSIFREMANQYKRAGLYCLLVLFSNLYATRNLTTSIAYVFAFANDNFTGYGIAIALTAVVVFDKWYKAVGRKDDNQWRILVILVALVMLATGVKGPIGAVVLLGIWATILLGIILRKIPIKTIGPLLLISAGFVIIYTVILGSKGQSNASGDSIIAFAKIADVAFWKKPMVDALKLMNIPRIIIYALTLLVFMLFFLSIFFLPFCLGYVREVFLVLTNQKDYQPGRVLVYAVFAIGFTAMMFLNYSGHSQIYFGLVAAFISPLISIWFLEDLEKENTKKSKITLNLCVVVMSLMLLFTSGTLITNIYGQIITAVANANPHKSERLYLGVSREEYEAMEWIEDNTERDALLATDRYYSVDPKEYSYENRWNNRFFLYGVYSNRFIYIGGSGYNMSQQDWPKRKEMIEINEELYDADNNKRGEVARELGVDYVVVSKRFTKIPNLENEDYELCYTNKDIDIYKIAE